jgi:hypothetical protein
VVEEEFEREPTIIFIHYKNGYTEIYGKSEGYEWDLTDNTIIVIRSKKEEILIPWVNIWKAVIKNAPKSSGIQNQRKITCLEV